MRTTITMLALGLLSAVGWAIPATAGTPDAGVVRVAGTGENAELVKTIPIARKADEARQVVMTLDLDKVGGLTAGDRLEATSEVEVSVCLKPNPRHPGPGQECVGKVYGYNPKVRTQLVVGPSASAAGGASTVAVSEIAKQRCTQQQPNRNHHCVLVIDDGELAIDDTDQLPCPPNDCHLNLALSAHHRSARGGHKLVVGAASNGPVVGDKGQVNAALFRPDGLPKPDPIVGSRTRPALSLAGDSQQPKKKVVYSARLSNPKAGEQIVIDAGVAARINQLPYNAFLTTAVVLGESPGAVKNNAPVNATSQRGRISKGNGYNCTQGPSGHKTPCMTRKVGVLEMVQDVNRSLYVNVVMGGTAKILDGQRERKRDKAKLLKKGFLDVYRYGG